jgi:FkbM family methyltransferase
MSLFAVYHSQVGQDQFLNENFFHNMRNGTFVEFGAHDGICISNSYFFESELDWQGICIEPIPEIFERLKNNRRCSCIQGCIRPVGGPVQFLRIGGALEMLSGVVDAYHPTHLLRVYSCAQNCPTTFSTIQVQAFRLDELLDAHKISHINYLSIDTEGGELEILQSIDFRKYRIDFITVEDNYSDVAGRPLFQQFLESRGFELVTRLAHDLVFKNRAFSYEHDVPSGDPTHSRRGHGLLRQADGR